MKRILYILLILVAAFGVMAPTTTGTPKVYYVNSSSSGGDGTTTATTGTHAAFATIAAVNAISFKPGDKILFNRGQIWRETLTPPSSGSAAAPITFGAYGTGANPTISAAEICGTAGSGLGAWFECGDLYNSGFKVYDIGGDGSGRDSFVIPNLGSGWASSYNWGSNTYTADTTVASTGLNSLKLAVGAGGGWETGSADLKQTITYTGNPRNIYLSVLGRVASGAVANQLAVRFTDVTNTRYLASNGTWSTNSTTMCMVWDGASNNTWTEKHLQITPYGTSDPVTYEVLVINFGATAGNSWVDNVYLSPTTGRSTTKVWGGAKNLITDYWALVKSGSRVNYHDGGDRVFPSTMTDGYFSSPFDYSLFFYRNDAGDPGNCSVGIRSYAIHINAKNYVTIDGVDCSGPCGTTGGTGSDGRLIFVQNSINPAIKNLTVSNSDEYNVYFKKDCTNALADNIISHGSRGVSVYFNCDGWLKNSTIYNVGQLTMDGGDSNGVGIGANIADGDPLGNLTIDCCEMYNINQAARNLVAGPEAAVQCSGPIGGPVNVTNCYIHDIPGLCIIYADCANGGTVANSSFVNFGYNSSSINDGNSNGYAAAIRVGGSTNGAVLNVKILNNIFTGGKGSRTYHGVIHVPNPSDNTGLVVQGNRFYNNLCCQFWYDQEHSAGELTANDNIYYLDSLVNAWNTQTTPVSTMALWRTGCAQEANSMAFTPPVGGN